jgi:hypothetical protein
VVSRVTAALPVYKEIDKVRRRSDSTRMDTQLLKCDVLGSLEFDLSRSSSLMLLIIHVTMFMRMGSREDKVAHVSSTS